MSVVKSYNNYEVLQNVDNGSRLIWADWDVYNRYPSGIVAGGSDFYIARKKLGEPNDNDVSSQGDKVLTSNQGFSHYLGKFEPKDSFGKMSILTEVSFIAIKRPILNYRLRNMKFGAALPSRKSA